MRRTEITHSGAESVGAKPVPRLAEDREGDMAPLHRCVAGAVRTVALPAALDRP